jgi:hypothetical protein
LDLHIKFLNGESLYWQGCHPRFGVWDIYYYFTHFTYTCQLLI